MRKLKRVSNTVRLASRTLFSSVDGPGLRTVLWFQGCTHACPGCHNPSTHALEGGEEFTQTEVLDWIRLQQWNKITFSGGEPFLQAEAMLDLLTILKQEAYSVWVYTGYTLAQIKGNPIMNKCLDYIDVLVDGPYIESLRDPLLVFKGSTNQNIHYLR